MVTINAKEGERHFVHDGGIAYTLTLKWLKLTGGDVQNAPGPDATVKAGGSIMLSGKALLIARECWFHNNQAVMGGSIYQAPGAQSDSGTLGTVSLYDTNITSSIATSNSISFPGAGAGGALNVAKLHMDNVHIFFCKESVGWMDKR